MVTTVTDNSPQSINTSLFAMDGEIQKVKKIAESFDEKLSGIDIETGVLSVNGKQGVVELTASDVDALPSSTVIPTTTSELENTSGFITSSDSITGNAATATTADKVKNALTVNGKTYDGSSAVDAGVQTIANGGTGASNGQDAFDNIVSGVRTSSNPEDNETMLIKSSSWYKTTVSDFWEYIKGKISSVLGLTASDYGGKAATATTADKAVEVVDYGDTLRTVKIGLAGPGVTADKLLYLAGYTELDSHSTKLKDVNKEEIIKWLGIPRIKYADYTTPSQAFTQFQQIPIELSNFSSEVTPDNVLCFMVIYWTGVKLIASADWGNTNSSGLKCALIALQAGTGFATIRCVYMV